jgi:serine/threonine-protein kinase
VQLIKSSRGDAFAVKLIIQTSSVPVDMLSQSFMREFEALFSLSHPCVVPLLGLACCQAGTIYALMKKHMENGSLRDVLRLVEAGKAPKFWTGTGTAIIVCVIACRQDFIHSAGFVHRYLKPTNLLIDERGRCLVGDFGSSKFIAERRRWTGGVVGTILYTAPELYDDPTYSTMIDVFAFDLIVYEIRVGWPVFSPTLPVKQIMDRARDRTRAAFPAGLDANVQTPIGRCWAVNPSERPSFAEIPKIMERTQFKILPDFDSSSVAVLLSDVRREVDRNAKKAR